MPRVGNIERFVATLLAMTFLPSSRAQRSDLDAR